MAGAPAGARSESPALVQGGKQPPQPAAAWRDGKVFLLSPKAELVASLDAGARPQESTTADLDGAASEQILPATAGPNRLHAIAAK